MTLELRHLRYFIAVAEEQHFGRAAVRLRIAQPGLSKQIKQLEEAIGVELLVRDKRHVEVTRAGNVFLHYARLAVGVVERAVENTRAASDGKVGLLKVGGYALAVYPAATGLLQEFELSFPDVHVEFWPGHALQCFEALTRRVIDVVIAYLPYPEFAPDIRYEPIGSVAPLVAMPTGHRLTSLERIPSSELLKEPFLAWRRDLNAPLVDHIREKFFGGAVHDRLIEVADVVEMLLRTAAGEGISIVNPAVLDLGMTNVEYRPLADPTAVFEYGLIWLETGVSQHVSPFVEVGRQLATRSHA